VVKSRNASMDAAYDDQVCIDDRTIDVTSSGCARNFGQATSSSI
jgi:hypothetical protein